MKNVLEEGDTLPRFPVGAATAPDGMGLVFGGVPTTRGRLRQGSATAGATESHQNEGGRRNAVKLWSNAVTTDSGTAKQKLSKLVNQGRHAAKTASSVDQLPETAHPPGPADLLGGRETKAFETGKELPNAFERDQRACYGLYPQ